MSELARRLLGLPEAASSHASVVDATLGWVHLLAIGLFAVWGVVLGVALWRFGRRSRRADAVPAPGARLPLAAEVAVVVAEAALLLGLSVPLVGELLDARRPLDDDAFTVRVVARQYAWLVHYPGPDGVFGPSDPARVDPATNPLGLERSAPGAADDVVTTNQLHLVVDRPTVVHLTSRDVVHGFHLAELRVQQDAIPGFTFPVRFTPTVTTEAMRARLGRDDFGYEIACAQLCGIGHHRMRGFLTVHTRDGFAAWMAGQQELLGVDDFWS
ncbi:MAG: hypothetical protein AAGC60_17080 [Acidobacteriota bacterium]